MKLLFAREPQQGIKAWCLIALSVGLMAADHHQRLNMLRDYLSLVVYPIQCVVDAPVRLSQTLQQYTRTYHQLIEENKQLRYEQFLQDARLQKSLFIEAENVRLRALLQATPRQNETLIAAEIIRVNSDPFVQRVILDKGSKQGITLGQPVIDADGIIGEVIEVHPHVSHVILITDANYGIPIENVRSRVRGIAVGTGAIQRLELQHVANTSDLEEGDILVTSGLDGRYPSGHPVGFISRIEHDPSEPFARVSITPSAHLERSRQVLLVQRSKEVGEGS